MRRQMPGALAQPDATERRQRLGFVGHAVEVLRQHHVFQRGEIGDQMELLEDQSDFFRAEAVELPLGEAGNIFAVDDDVAFTGTV